MKSLGILGRQPALGIAELESLFGAAVVQPLQGNGVLLDVPATDIDFARLGGVVKLGGILTTLETVDWFEIEEFLIDACVKNSMDLPEGKLTIGVSVYGIKVTPNMLERTVLSIKKAIKSTGRPVRIVPNKAPEISTPQIVHNKLTGDNGWELLLYKKGTQTILARTNYVQDIESYTARDQARPMRDARVGMLPPKLAQIIINLATSATPLSSETTVLDPFCGTGVILQEAALMGSNTYGTDLEPRMVEYSNTNMRWLTSMSEKVASLKTKIIEADATNTKWEQPITVVACEGYLGMPFGTEPPDKQLQDAIRHCDNTARGFLKNLSNQTKPGFRVCVALPAWHIKNHIKHLPCLDVLVQFDWQRVEFKHAKTSDLIYHRDDQVVGRELVVIVKI
jgi:tRNA G10  N-methylase Trm11